jgi:hypothetical protein
MTHLCTVVLKYMKSDGCLFHLEIRYCLEETYEIPFFLFYLFVLS